MNKKEFKPIEYLATNFESCKLVYERRNNTVLILHTYEHIQMQPGVFLTSGLDLDLSRWTHLIKCLKYWRKLPFGERLQGDSQVPLNPSLTIIYDSGNRMSDWFSLKALFNSRHVMFKNRLKMTELIDFNTELQDAGIPTTST